MICLWKKGRKENLVFSVDEMVISLCDGFETQFEIDPDEKLGEGGNAIVYKCREKITSADYAIKIQVANYEGSEERFNREKTILRSVHHDQLMTCIASGVIEMTMGRRRGRYPYVIMPVADRNMLDLIDAQHLPSKEDLMGQFCGLSGALAELHRWAIHRDIKPQNVLIKGSTWILSDFGLCKLVSGDGVDITMADDKVGPVYWMSPESMNRVLGNGDEITKASDVFQLAAVFWFAATGRHPTGIVSRSDWHGADSVYNVLVRALSHSPSVRPQDGEEFYSQIVEAVRHA